MVGALLLMAVVQGTPLQRAESLVVAGDTSQAVRELKVALEDQKAPEQALLATIALQWLGRGPSGGFYKSAWREVNRVWGDLDVATIVTTLSEIEGRGFGRPEVDSAFAALGRRLDRLSPALQAAFAWTQAQRSLYALSRNLAPALGPSSVPCPRGVCPVIGGLRMAEVIASDAKLTIAMKDAREALTESARGPWPLAEVSVRSLAGLTILGSDTAFAGTLKTLASEVPVRDWTRLEVNAALAELQGHRDSLNRLFEANRALVNRYDTLLADLGSHGQLPPAVLWRTGWPLYLVPFNERLTAHRVRFLLADLLTRFAPPAATLIDGYGERVQLVRQGLPERVSLVNGGTMLARHADPRTNETLLAYHGDSGQNLSIDVALAARDRNIPRTGTGFVSQFYDQMSDLSHQLISYARNGRAMVDFYGAPPKATCEASQRSVGFYLLDNHLVAVRRLVDTAATPGPMAYTMELGPGQYVYSLEMLDRGCRQAARARYAFRVLLPTRSFSLSTDVALATEVRGGVVQRLNGPLPITPVPGVAVRAGTRLLLYWEVYGVANTTEEAGRLSVVVDAVDLRRNQVPVRELAAVQRDAGTAKATGTVSWLAEAPAGSDPIGMSIGLELPAEHVGVVVLRVKVTDTRTMQVAESRRTMLIVP